MRQGGGGEGLEGWGWGRGRGWIEGVHQARHTQCVKTVCAVGTGAPRQRRTGIRKLDSKVVVHGLLLRAARDAVIVKLEPVASGLRADEGAVVSAVRVARVYEHAVQVVDLRLGEDTIRNGERDCVR